MSDKKKVMISQPMAGLTNEEIKAAKEKAVKYLEGIGYEVRDTFFEGEWTKKEEMERRGIVNIPVCFLARSIEAMSTCHAVYFCKGWENARGCVIEHEIANKYDLEVIYEEYIESDILNQNIDNE